MVPAKALERLKTRFESDPSLAAAFEALEEHYFVGGQWDDLVALYERRLGSPDLDPEKKPKQHAKVAFRLAQVLERGKIAQSWRMMRQGMTLLSPSVPGTDWTSLSLKHPLWAIPGIRKPFPAGQ